MSRNLLKEKETQGFPAINFCNLWLKLQRSQKGQAKCNSIINEIGNLIKARAKC